MLKHNISGIVPLPLFGGIRPVCVPMQPDSSFSEEIGSRFTVGVGQLWERLGLVFLIEESQPETTGRNETIINNFSSRLILQLFGNKNIRRLVENAQPGYYFPDMYIKQAQRRQRQTEQRISAEITERILQTERISEQLNAFSDMLTRKNDDSCSVQMMCSLLTSVMKRHTGAGDLSAAEVQVIERLEQRLRNSDSVQEKKLYSVFEELRTAEAAPEERRTRILSAAEQLVTALPGSDERIASELAAAELENGDPGDIAERIAQTVKNLDVILTEKRYQNTVLSSGSGEAERQAVGRVKSIDEPQDIRRSVTELLLKATDSEEMQGVTGRIADSFSGKGIEEIHRFIRSVYGQRGNSSREGVVTDIARDVVCRIMERRKVMPSNGSGIMDRTAAELRSGHSENTRSAGGDTVVYSTEGRVLPGESNSYTLNRAGDLYLGNSVENSYYADPTGKAPAAAARNFRTVSERYSGKPADSHRINVLNGAESLSAITGDNGKVNYSSIKNAVSLLMNTGSGGDEYVNSTIFGGRDIRYLQNSAGDNVQNIIREGDVYLSTSAANTAPVPEQGTTSHSAPTAEGKVLPTAQNTYSINREGDVYLSTPAANTAPVPEQGTKSHSAPTAEGKVLPTTQNTYNISREGDVYLSTSAANTAPLPEQGTKSHSAPTAEGK
ncbi:MAG: hypothetical protein MR291_10300, partial [Oscillospiraceae bacterium]|nr:hypothetical protein [Oscillospiraceae bacterium]